MSSRILEPAPYGSDGVEEFVLPQLVGRSLLMTTGGRRGRKDARYRDATAFWVDVLDERLATERIVHLEAMRIFEWFPRNPGLFHTERGKIARELAQYHLMDLDARKYRRYIDGADAPPDHAQFIRKITESDRAARQIIFTPRGKMSMLQGGVGCVRYKSFNLLSGAKVWLMSAASEFAPDEGVPLLMPDDIYQHVIDEIREKGFASADLVGRVRFIQDQFRDLYSSRYGIPRLYVEIEGYRFTKGASQGSGMVSVATSFSAEIDGEAAIYAAYVTFDPGHRGARRSAIDWMQEEYIRGIYKGEVLTDFDQQAPTFSNTLFCLEDVMTSPDLVGLIGRLRTLYGHFDWSMLERANINLTLDRRDMRMEVHIGGDARNVVIGGHGSSNSLVITESQMQDLARDLQDTKRALKAEPDSDDRDRIVGAIADAEAAARASDPTGVDSALRRLKPMGKKAADVLEKVGIGLAVAAAKAVIGF